jgi:hypothetical protein
MRSKSKPKARPEPFRTKLSELLLWDPVPQSMALHDVDPFGVYHTAPGAQVAFDQALRVAPSYTPCPSPDHLDALIARVFLAAARHWSSGT